MKYYIKVTSWNLLESFVTESISPYSFYHDRNFGNNLSRYLDKSSELTNYLLLSTEDRGGEYTIEVDECLIDKRRIIPVKKNKSIFLYDRTIYYKKGSIRFRFSTLEQKDALIAETQILLEVKTIDKYAEDFYVEPIKAKHYPRIGNTISYEQSASVQIDNIYNKIKGAIIGYACGRLENVDSNVQKLIVQVREMKNSLAGLHTQIMMYGSKVGNGSQYLERISKCKELYETSIDKKTNLFDILRQQFLEVVKIVEVRSQEFQDEGKEKMQMHLMELTKQKEAIEMEMSKYEICDLISELNEIKNQEKKNGERVGKSRVYFKKGTKEYERKKYLKAQIRDFEHNNPDYRELKEQLKAIKESIIQSSVGAHKYDATIKSLFDRMSDTINNIVANIDKNASHREEFDLTSLVMDIGKIRLAISSGAESDFFNIVLQKTVGTDEEVMSDNYILNLIESSAIAFKKMPSSQSAEGIKILDCLRNYWAYKKHKGSGFTIPKELEIFSSIMAFFVKPFGFEQIERYMQNNDIYGKEYSFMLWGASIGYASLPKTLTKSIYNNPSAYTIVDNYLFSVMKGLYEA